VDGEGRAVKKHRFFAAYFSAGALILAFFGMAGHGYEALFGWLLGNLLLWLIFTRRTGG